MGKLSPVPPAPEPVDPFKQQGPPPLGVVTSSEVSAVPEKAPKIGVVYQRPSQVVSVAPEVQVPIGVVRPAVAPPPPTPPWLRPSPLGAVQDETPVYPPVAPAVPPPLGTIEDKSITPPPPVDDSLEPPPPVATQPVIVDPFQKEE